MLKVKTKYDHREEFCAALRSGRYIQRRGSDIVGRWGKTEACALMAWALYTGRDEGSIYVDFEELTGLDSEEVYSMNDGSCDHEPSSFEEIAQWVESQP
jgi:hypothetical protein